MHLAIVVDDTVHGVDGELAPIGAHAPQAVHAAVPALGLPDDRAEAEPFGRRLRDQRFSGSR